MVSGWWLVIGGWWLVIGGWLLVVGDCLEPSALWKVLQLHKQLVGQQLSLPVGNE